MSRSNLPIVPYLGAIRQAVDVHRAAVVMAPPGAGKTTRVAPELVDAGPVLLLQPRRMAARSLARRIASERDWTLGQQVGWQVRFERRFSERTRLLVATEGVLTARLQADPLLSTFATVVLDEFHERSVHADLALTLLREARNARNDLRVVVMSATIDPEPVVRFLSDCPVIDLPGRAHPLTIDYDPQATVVDAVGAVLAAPGGHLLVFLPGAPEIERSLRELRPRLPRDCELLPLYGALDGESQDRALALTSRRKVILATNIAETSLTIDGVTDVLDTGLHKVVRRDPALGLDRLEVERISRDSADQRAGRAGRTGPGRVLRLWDSRDQLRARREPEIQRVDLASPLLAVLAWGADPATLQWFERPDEQAMQTALQLLERLGALRSNRITPLGEILRRMPLHPRLGRVLLGCGATARAAAACAVLDGAWRPPGPPEATACDLLPAIDRIDRAPWRVREAARQLERIGAALAGEMKLEEWVFPGDEEERLCRALLAAYPDRVAGRRREETTRLKLAGGHGAVLGPESGVRAGEFLIAIELRAARRGQGAEARVSRAARIDPDWLEPTGREIVHVQDAATGRVRAFERVLYESLVLRERPIEVDPDRAAVLRRDRLLERGVPPAVAATLRRMKFAGILFDLGQALLEHCRAEASPGEFDPLSNLDWKQREQLKRLAPDRLRVPSGREVPLEYHENGRVVASVKLQELFGLAESPTLGPANEPVTFSLLAPSGRPVQTTRDLRSFWNGAYAQVRAELRGRYPKHPWPEDPWSAEPTSRTKRRR